MRGLLAVLMVRVHLISRELADYHIQRMTDAEVARRVEQYRRQDAKEMELEVEQGAVGEQSERSTSFPPGFDARNDSSTHAALCPASVVERKRGCAKARNA